MERKPRRDAIEILNEVKQKHQRGVSQNRFDNFAYSELLKRNKEGNKMTNKTQVYDNQAMVKANHIDQVQQTN